MTSKVDFYILEASGQKSLLFACSLLEKAHTNAEKVFIYTANAAESEQVDNLLWTYRDDSFLPHAIYQSTESFPPPILISHEKPIDSHDILLNLSQQLPIFYLSYPHIIEIVPADPTVQALARERYRQYRDAGCHLNTIKLKSHEL
jgi:DNA polymerase III subunit chi